MAQTSTNFEELKRIFVNDRLLKLKQTIADRNFSIEDLSFFNTHKCNLKCMHCMRGDAQAVDMDSHVPDAVLDYFSDDIYANYIHLLGGEPQMNPNGVKHLYDSLKKHKTQFNYFSLVTNGTMVNQDFFEAVSDVHGLENHKRETVVCFSNDYYHKQANKTAGIDEREIDDNFNKIKERYKRLTVLKRDFVDRDEYTLHRLGRARNLTGVPFVKNFSSDLVFVRESLSNWHLCEFDVDTNGNVVKGSSEYIANETDNFGNVLKTSPKDILLEHGKI